MAPTVLVTGASGLLGRQVLKAFQQANWNVVGIGFTRANPPSIIKVDLCDPAAIDQVLEDAKPQLVIHCAAQRFPDRVEADPDAASALNIDASKALATAASKRSILLIYISTDYVFSGAKGEAPYESHSKTGPSNSYGQMKLNGEKSILEVTKDKYLGLVLRVPVLYGPTEGGNKESAVNTLMDSLQKAQLEKVIMDGWSIRYPTNTEDVGRILVALSTVFLDTSPEQRSKMDRIYQFSSEDRCTKFQICERLAEVMGMSMGKMEANKEGNDPNAKVQRPYDCHLSTKGLQDLGINVTAQDFKGWWRWQVGAFRK